MKHFLSMLPVLLLPALAWADGPVSAEDFLAQLPPQPKDACWVAADTSPRDEFNSKVDEVKNKVQKEIARRRKEINNADPNKKMMAAAVDVPGFEGIDKEQLKKMSKEEKRKKAEALMEEKYGMDMKKLKKMKETDKEGRQEWAESVAREQQVAEKINPEKTKADKKKMKDTEKLITEQQNLFKQLSEQVKLYHDRLREVEEDPYGVKLRQEIEAKEKLMTQIATVENCQKRLSFVKLLYDMKTTYCSNMSKKHVKILSEYRVMLLDSFSRYEKLDLLGREIVKNRGAELPDDAIGISGLEALRGYTSKFMETFKYRLNDRPFTGNCEDLGAGG